MTDQANVTPLRSIDEMVHLIHKSWEAVETTIESAQTKVKSLRVKTGLLLNELRQRVEAGEVGELATWWDWYEDRFTRSRKDAEQLMRIAGAPDPTVAHEAEKTATRQRVAAIRSMARTVRAKNSTEKSKPDLKVVHATPREPMVDRERVEMLIAQFLKLNRDERLLFVKRLRQVYRED